MDLNDPNTVKIGTAGHRLTDDTRHLIVEQLLSGMEKNGKPRRGLFNEVASKYHVSRRSISTLWKQAKSQIDKGQPINVKRRLPGVVGRKPQEYDLSGLAEIPLNRRSNIRGIASAIGVSKSTAHKLVKRGLIKPHSSAIKPTLTAENKRKRVIFCLSKLAPINTFENPKFESMHNYIHIDEKWFYMTQANRRYYLLPHEDDPHRTCKSKGFIGKMMFLCGATRPDIGEDREVIFDGKIGIFPFIKMIPAQRNSKNRAAGTLEVKAIESISKDVVRDFMVHKLIPAIKEKWPSYRSKTIYIQQDNARPHISPVDIEFKKAATSDGFDIQLTCQPPNSPDLNVLDLGWFRAIQTLQHEMAPRSIEELLDAVQLAFDRLKPTSLNNVWLTLQNVMKSVIETNGDNYYKVPHMSKGRMLREGNLPEAIEVPADTLQAAYLWLRGGEAST